MIQHGNFAANKIVFPKLYPSNQVKHSRNNYNIQMNQGNYITRLDQLDKPWGSNKSLESM